MKNNKGFTLVEVIAVTMLLSMLALIVIPLVLNQKKKQAEKIKDSEIKILYADANRYVKENNLLEENKTKCIGVNYLINEGYASIDAENYKTKYIKVITDENNSIENSLATTCTENVINKVTVTFDANGGTVSETSRTYVTGSTYGKLPTPTRSGYTFEGWNGKNKIDKSKSGVAEIVNETSRVYWASPIFNNEWVINNLNPSTQYSISYDIDGISIPEYNSRHSGNLGLLLYSQNNDTSTYPSIYMMNRSGHYISVGEKYHYETSITTTSDVNLSSAKYVIYAYSNRFLKDGTGVFATIRLYNIQLEEGEVATEYEPYYITANTKVTQTSDHTLKAIWKANSQMQK